jgi:hypothetical protein
MKAPADCRLVGRWRIVEVDFWDRDCLDLAAQRPLPSPRTAVKSPSALCRLDIQVEYARDSIGFRWSGCDEGDEVQGDETAELLDDGTIEIEFAYDNGDEAVSSETKPFFNSLLSCSPSLRLTRGCMR